MTEETHTGDVAVVDTLFDGHIGDYVCEDIDVRDYDRIHIDTGGTHISVKGRRCEDTDNETHF